MYKLILDKGLGDNLRAIRKARRMTQNDVTAKLQLLGSNIERTTYSKVETGQRNIRLSDLVLLKYIFGVDYSSFFEGLATPELIAVLKEHEML